MRHVSLLVVGCLSFGCGVSAPDGMPGVARPDGEAAAPNGAAGAGTLTAGVWDDNLNFDFFLDYLAATEATALPGLPRVARADRLVVDVRSESGTPVGGATVTVSSGGTERLRTTSGADGRVLFFPAWAGVEAGGTLTLEARLADAHASVTAIAGEPSAVLTLSVSAPAPGQLDVAFVIDTTGSMGDELRYLQTEIDAIAASLAASHPGVQQRWGLVVYRDQGDEYVTRSHAFTTDVALFRTRLAGESVGGGGDYPEAPHRALAETMKLDWRGGATARLAFLVADAPHHPGEEDLLLQAIGSARERGVRLYPIAASGTDELAEFSMRTAAQLTGGRYLFLTDDSGVGEAHKEPTLPCYLVTRLDHAILRVIETELTGTYREALAAQVIRTGGSPTDGRCALAGGRVVTVY